MMLLFVFALTAVVHAIDTSAYAARMAGVRTGRLALAGSLYNVLTLGSRGANSLARPLIASVTDLAANEGLVSSLLFDYRLMLAAASVGTLLAGLLIPTLSRILVAAVASYERRRSLPRVIVRGISVRGFGRMRRDLVRPRLAAVRRSWRSPFPRRFLVASILVTALYSVSSLAALYASALVPQGARTASSLSPLVTGVGMVLMVLVVDPISALVTDQALRGQRPLEDVTYVTVWQVGARLAGTLLAQALLAPAGGALAELTRWLVP
jgi:hypothetical protein